MTVLSGIFLVLFSSLGLTQSQLSPDDIEKVNSFMADIMECTQMPGAALALLKENEIALTQGYGFADLEQQTPVTDETLFAIGSVTKSFTTTLMSKLLSSSDGLSWDSVASDLSNDIYFYNGYVRNHTTFRDLVSHQTCIPRHDATWIFGQFDQRSDIVERVRFMDPTCEFRSEFVYNNVMFDVAMHPLEQALSLTWEELLTTELLQPLGMESTTFYDVAEDTGYEGFATPYVWDIDNPDSLIPIPYETWSGSAEVGPAGSVSSTAADMGRWLRFILQGGLSQDGQMIMETDDLLRLWNHESAFEIGLFTKPFWPVTDSSDSYGLAYFNGHYRGYRVHSHGGDLTGFHSEVFIVPDMGVATFFTTNFGGITLERQLIHQYMTDILLGVEPAFNSSLACDFLENLSFYNQDDFFEDFPISANTIDLLRSLDFSDDLMNHFTRKSSHATAGLPKALARELNELVKTHNRSGANRKVESYTGTYGNFAHGNLTVSLSEACEDCLFMQYGELGQYTLLPTNATDVFLGENEYFLFRVTPVIFSGTDANGNAEFMSPVLFEISNPPMFQRGLSMEDAPPPPIDVCY